MSACAFLAVVGTLALRGCRPADHVSPHPSVIAPSPTPWSLAAELMPDGPGWQLVLRGEPRRSVLVVRDGLPVRVLTLDDQGQGAATGLALDSASPVLEIIPLAGPVVRVALPVSPTPTAPAEPTPTPSPSATATATSTPGPSPTPSPVTVPPTATPGASRDADGRIRVEPLPFIPRPAATAIPAPRRSPPATPTVPAGGAGPSPPLLHLVTDAGPRLAITFDGSSSTDGTANLLDLLHELDLEVTLFVTGEFIEANPAVVRRALLAGHEIGSHSYSHPHLTTYATNKRHDLLPGVDRDMLHAQLRRTEEAFRKATGRPMAPLWRAPYGEENAALRAWAFELGYLHVRWSSLEGASLDSLDWVEDEHSSLYRDSRRMMQRLLRFPRLEGGIVLMHLATRRAEPPWGALPDFVAELRRRGLEPVRVSELLQSSATWQSWLDRAAQNHRRTFGPGLRAPRRGGEE